MPNLIHSAIETLDETQRRAVSWQTGPLIVFAGPGTGKTKVLTTRIAKILHDSKNEYIRILALTYTNKAADEMRGRVDSLIPGYSDQYFIGTIHKFCSNILRKHGEKIGIRPDFSIHSRDVDLIDIVNDALERIGEKRDSENQYSLRYLNDIKKVRRSLVNPADLETLLRKHSEGFHFSRLYHEYERMLTTSNALDFSGLIINASKLIDQEPSIASEYRRVYKYWFVDEFQDTTKAQYYLLKKLAGRHFNNFFVVADEDQIIFEWAGASHTQIKNFQEDFDAKVIQIDQNRRCPSTVVKIANRMIKYNKKRYTKKKTFWSAAESASGTVKVRSFYDEYEEAHGVVKELSSYISDNNSELAIIGRTNKVLEPIMSNLRKRNIKASIAKRRDNFLTPHFSWLLSCLQLVNHRDSRSSFRTLIQSGNKLSGADFDPDSLIDDHRSKNINFLALWINLISKVDDGQGKELKDIAGKIDKFASPWDRIVEESVERLVSLGVETDRQETDRDEDHKAWNHIYKSFISVDSGEPALEEFIQEMSLRSKEPPVDPSEVRLYTIHTAKGLEFDHVWMIGMVDDILPTYQSLKPDANPNSLEAERRACFVGITRTKKTLQLSYAKSYRGHSKVRSRFLDEMGLSVEDDVTSEL